MSKQIRTHYDNLMVSRNASPEVIRAAYKTLSQKFHPDKNPGNVDAQRIMAIINTSYEVLSDPDRRREHDLWVEQQELGGSWTETEKINPHQPQQQTPTPRQTPPRATSSGILAHVSRYWFLYGAIAFAIWIWSTDNKNIPALEKKPYQVNPSAVRPTYVRSSAAPNGSPWPVASGYVSGYQRLNNDGLSTVTVDNSRNDSDVFVKLVSLSGAQAYPIRHFFIPAFGRFTLHEISAGGYDIRYRDLSSGALSRSEAFQLEEIATNSGTQFSNITMTLYKVHNGNMQTYSLSEAEF